jgi:long-chain acyl-CoA synthetase
VDPVTTGAWVEEQRLHATSHAALVALPEVGQLVAAEVGRVLRDQPGGDAVQRCVLAPRRLDPQQGEVTRSRVVRRHVVCAHLSDELAALSHPAAHSAVATVADVPGAPVPAVEGARA